MQRNIYSYKYTNIIFTIFIVTLFILTIMFICNGCNGIGVIDGQGPGNRFGIPCKECNGTGLIFNAYKFIILIIVGLVIYLGLSFLAKKITNDKSNSRDYQIKVIFIQKSVVRTVILLGILGGFVFIPHGLMLNPSIAGGIFMFNGFSIMTSGCILYFLQ